MYLFRYCTYVRMYVANGNNYKKMYLVLYTHTYELSQTCIVRTYVQKFESQRFSNSRQMIFK